MVKVGDQFIGTCRHTAGNGASFPAGTEFIAIMIGYEPTEWDKYHSLPEALEEWAAIFEDDVELKADREGKHVHTGNPIPLSPHQADDYHWKIIVTQKALNQASQFLPMLRYQALKLIVEGEEYPSVDLADQLGVPKSHLEYQVENLEWDGLIQLHYNPTYEPKNERWINNISYTPTEKGKRLLQRIAEGKD